MKYTKEQIKDLMYFASHQGCLERECSQCTWQLPSVKMGLPGTCSLLMKLKIPFSADFPTDRIEIISKQILREILFK